MGLLDDFDIDLHEYEASEGGFAQPEAGWYEYQIASLRLKTSSTNDPNFKAIFIDYLITNEEIGVAGEIYSEMFVLPKHNPPTANERKPLQRYKYRLIQLGVPEDQITDLTSEDVEGIVGTFELEKSRAQNGKEYVNVRNLTVDDGDNDGEPVGEPEEEEAEEAAPVKKVAKAAPKTAPATKTSRFSRG